MVLRVPILALLLLTPTTVFVVPPGAACHPDVAGPEPIVVPLAGRQHVVVDVQQSNGGCSHQPSAEACVTLYRGAAVVQLCQGTP